MDVQAAVQPRTSLQMVKGPNTLFLTFSVQTKLQGLFDPSGMLFIIDNYLKAEHFTRALFYQSVQTSKWYRLSIKFETIAPILIDMIIRA